MAFSVRRLCLFRGLLSQSLFPASSAVSTQPLIWTGTTSVEHRPPVRYASQKTHTRERSRALKIAPETEFVTHTDLEANPLDEIKAVPNLQQWRDIVFKLCGTADRYVPSDEWSKAHTEFLNGTAFNKASFFGGLMTVAGALRYQAFGDSLMDHLYTHNGPFNVTIISRYFKLLGRTQPADAETKLFRAYDKLKQIHPSGMYDISTAEHLISGLYITSRWQDCLKFLDIMAFSGRPGVSAYSYVVAAAFVRDQADVAWRMLRLIKAIPYVPTLTAWTAWLDWAKRGGTGRVMEMLKFVRDVEWNFPFEVAKDLRTYLEARGEEEVGTGLRWVGKFTSISGKGQCKGCGQYLEPLTVTKEEFTQLRDNFIRAVIEGTDVFLRSNPGELARYRKFVEQHAPFDLVVDGLNVAFSHVERNYTNRALAQRLRKVLEYLQEHRRRKILVLGRQHMHSWPKDEMQRIQRAATCFFAENISQDDPFLLYAALYSGTGCDFLSGDLMRDHGFKLEERNVELRKIFLKWQRIHQLEVLKIHSPEDVALKAPIKYDPIAQFTDSSIHLPYNSGMLAGLHELPSTWLCMEKISSARFMEPLPSSTAEVP